MQEAEFSEPHLKASRAGAQTVSRSCYFSPNLRIMEKPAEAAAPSFSQVAFTDIPYSYPPATPVTCRYALGHSFQPSSRDWVGIFKVGWSTTKDYHTFVWVEQTQEGAGQPADSKHAEFKEYYLPKDDQEFYQFCYVDGGGQVRGASTPFCFRTPPEQSGESSRDEELLVVTTQDQVDQSVREKAELQSELDRTSTENSNLKSSLQREQQQSAALQEENKKKDTEMSEMAKKLDEARSDMTKLEGLLEQLKVENQQVKVENQQLKVENQQLKVENQQVKVENQQLKVENQQVKVENQQLKVENQQVKVENQQLKGEAALQQRSLSEQKQQTQSLVVGGSSGQKEEKYERAVLKINKQKEELVALRTTSERQIQEIATLKTKLREGEWELSKASDRLQLLQVDLQSSENKNQRLTAELQKLQSLSQNLDEARKQNQELNRRLSEVRMEPARPEQDQKDCCRAAAGQLDQVRAQLQVQREESSGFRSRCEHLERDLQDVSGQLDKIMRILELEQRKSSKYELQLTEITRLMAEKDVVMEEKDQAILLEQREKYELNQENQALRRDNEGLRRIYADRHRARSDSQLNLSVQTENVYETVDDVQAQQQQQQQQQQEEQEEQEESLVCHLCLESFPGITADELQLHQQTHRLCPFCSVVCDAMEQSEYEDHVYAHEV